MRQQPRGDRRGKGITVYRQGTTRRQFVRSRHFHDQPSRAAHFPMKQANSIAFVVVGPEGIGTDHFREMPGSVRESPDFGAHFVDDNRHAHLGGLPCGLGSGHAAADDVKCLYHGGGLGGFADFGKMLRRSGLVDRIAARAMRHEHQEAARDGKVLEKHGHLKLISRVEVVKHRGQHTEARAKKGKNPGLEPGNKGEAENNLEQDRRPGKEGGKSARSEVSRKPGNIGDFTRPRDEEEDTDQNPGDEGSVRCDCSHAGVPLVSAAYLRCNKQ